MIVQVTLHKQTLRHLPPGDPVAGAPVGPPVAGPPVIGPPVGGLDPPVIPPS